MLSRVLACPCSDRSAPTDYLVLCQVSHERPDLSPSFHRTFTFVGMSGRKDNARSDRTTRPGWSASYGQSERSDPTAQSSHSTSSERSARLAAGINRVSDAALAFRDSWRETQTPATTTQIMTQQHKAAQARHTRELRRYTSKLRRLKHRTQAATGMAVVTGTVALADVVTAGPEVWFWIGAPTAVISGWIARGSSERAKHLQPPEDLKILAPPPEPLPEGFVGHLESAKLNSTRVQLAQLLPEIDRLHSQAAVEIRAADAEAAPALGSLVNRLALLHQVSTGSPGTAAAATASKSSAEIRRWLADGVQMYEELLRASVELLGAPGPQQLTVNRLNSTVSELSAYSEGLRRTADAIPPSTY
jgi:hypothetical protein